MGIYEQLVIPPSSHHVELMNFFLVVSLLLFLPFIGMVFGGSFFSLVFSMLGKKTKNPDYMRFSKDILDKLTINKNIGIGLGILPAFSITFVYAQLLYKADVITVSVLLFACILYSFAFFFIYKFKNAFQVEGIIKSMKDYMKSKSGEEGVPKNVESYESNLDSIGRKSGAWGFLIMFFASFFFIGGTTIAADPYSWADVTSIMKFFILGDVWVNFFYFISLSFTVSGIAILFFFFRWQGGIKGIDANYKKLIIKFSVTTAFISAIGLLLFLFLKFLFLPQVALSVQVFVYTGLSLVAILLVCNLLYAVLRNSQLKLASIAFVMIFLVFTFSVLKDQLVLGNALEEHILQVTAEADKIDQQKLAEVISTASDISGQEIYDTKCIACHTFDHKLVGPPYNETLPKYNGDVKKLADFVNDPTKVDANYPAMPNQGLTKAQANAVAQYIMSEFQKGK